MDKISVNLANGRYDIHIGGGAYGRLLSDLSERKGKIFLVVDSNAMSFHSHVILDAIPGEPTGIYFTDGEKDKNMDTVASILEEAASAGLTRSDCFVAFGGGVCGDITGFCASIYMRGVDYYQVPTTLLSQVDSSVGGKTGVDLRAGKNLAGAFCQPCGVYINPGILRTLPDREIGQGKAEMIKAALIKDSGLFEKFEKSEIVTEENIAECIRIKLSFVEGDELDTGKRMTLNFGHTIGHAIEKIKGYGKVPHGEAVAIGMAMSSSLSEKAGISKKGTAARVEAILRANGLPCDTEIRLSEMADAFRSDKKNFGGELNSVFLEEIGRPMIKKMSIDDFAGMEESL